MTFSEKAFNRIKNPKVKKNRTLDKRVAGKLSMVNIFSFG